MLDKELDGLLWFSGDNFVGADTTAEAESVVFFKLFPRGTPTFSIPLSFDATTSFLSSASVGDKFSAEATARSDSPFLLEADEAVIFSFDLDATAEGDGFMIGGALVLLVLLTDTILLEEAIASAEA